MHACKEVRRYWTSFVLATRSDKKCDIACTMLVISTESSADVPCAHMQVQRRSHNLRMELDQRTPMPEVRVCLFHIQDNRPRAGIQDGRHCHSTCQIKKPCRKESQTNFYHCRPLRCHIDIFFTLCALILLTSARPLSGRHGEVGATRSVWN